MRDLHYTTSRVIVIADSYPPIRYREGRGIVGLNEVKLVEEPPIRFPRKDPELSIATAKCGVPNEAKKAKCNVCHETVAVSVSGALAVHPQHGWTMEAGRLFHCKGSGTRPTRPNR